MNMQAPGGVNLFPCLYRSNVSIDKNEFQNLTGENLCVSVLPFIKFLHHLYFGPSTFWATGDSKLQLRFC